MHGCRSFSRQSTRRFAGDLCRSCRRPDHTGSDHTREYVPALFWSKAMERGNSLGDRQSFADIAASLAIISGFQEKSPERVFYDCLVWRVPLILEVLFDKIANSVPARGHLFEETDPMNFAIVRGVLRGSRRSRRQTPGSNCCPPRVRSNTERLI